MNNLEIKMVRGTGAAVNVPCGYIPGWVAVYNMTDGDKIHMGFPGMQVMPFSGGGTNTILPGHKIKGATSRATAYVTHVLLDSGSWAGGDAAGWIFIDVTSKVGTFQSENIYVTTIAGATDDATVTVDVNMTVDVDVDTASATGNAGISAYVGSSSDSLGFTLGSTISEDAKLLMCVIARGGPGANGFKIANSL